MKLKKLILISGTLAITSISAHANWLCNVVNDAGHQWTVAAPDENSAEAMAFRVCSSSKIEKSKCTPDCFDNGITAGRWHCSVSNKQGQHWSYVAPTKKEAESLAKHGCNLASLNQTICKPSCIPE